MITKNHPSAYAELFKKAQDVLSIYGSGDFKNVKISNIDDYFGCLAELARIENENENIDPIFTILPATEETFNIDANKRTISIPDNFAKYGVGVQGDEIAEILYFSIDRYFDAMDLSEMDIIVQWRHSTDNDIVEFLSATYKKSLSLQPGKIVFGWPITSDMTNRSGNIQFSIRFYRRENSELIYSFSTLPTNIKIQAGLNFSLSPEDTNLAINKNAQIYSNLRNSKPAEVGYIIASPVYEAYYLLDGNNFIIPNEDLTYDLGSKFVVKAVIPANTPNDEYISGAGIAYTWYNKENNNEVLSTHIYKEDPRTSYNPNEIYYIKEIDESGVEYYNPYYIVGDNNPFDDKNSDGEPITLYTRHSLFEPSAAGTYYAIAKNVYAEKPGANKMVSSKEWIVPHPQEPLFEYNPSSKELIMEESGAEIMITPSVADNGVLSFSWKYNEIDNNFINAISLGNNNLNTYMATKEGYYFVEASNSKNADSITIHSSAVWAHFKASELGDITHYVNGEATTNYAVEIGSNLKVSVEAPMHSSKIEYQWYKNGVAIEGAVNQTLENVEQGNYYCILKNTYKGTVSNEKQSATFKV